MTAAARWALRVIALLMLLATAAMLLACGGGDPDEQPTDQLPAPPPLDCKARPEVCR